MLEAALAMWSLMNSWDGKGTKLREKARDRFAKKSHCVNVWTKNHSYRPIINRFP